MDRETSRAASESFLQQAEVKQKPIVHYGNGWAEEILKNDYYWQEQLSPSRFAIKVVQMKSTSNIYL